MTINVCAELREILKEKESQTVLPFFSQYADTAA